MNGHGPGALTPAVNFFDRFLDVVGGDSETRLQSMRRGAAEVVQIPMARAHELHLE